jgi:hypothetical protein
MSYTELEFKSATAAGLDRLAFLLDTDADNVGIPPAQLMDRQFGERQDAFRDRVRDGALTVQPFGYLIGVCIGGHGFRIVIKEGASNTAIKSH